MYWKCGQFFLNWPLLCWHCLRAKSFYCSCSVKFWIKYYLRNEKKHDAQLHFIQIHCDIVFLYYSICNLLYACMYSLTTLYLVTSYLYGYLINVTFYLEYCSHHELSFLFPPAESHWMVINWQWLCVLSETKFKVLSSLKCPIVYFDPILKSRFLTFIVPWQNKTL